MAVSFSKEDGPRRRQVIQSIELVKPPPPPPPPEEKPPEPEIKEEVKIEEPEPVPQDAAEAPADNNLGVDAEGGAGGDAFGLVGKPGGSDLLGSGGPTVGGTNRAGWASYDRLVSDGLHSLFARDPRLKKGEFRAVLRIWLDEQGRVTRYELAAPSGNAEIDAGLRDLLATQPDLGDAPPPDMPLPIKLRVNSRRLG